MTFTLNTIYTTDLFFKSFGKVILVVEIATCFHYLSWNNFVQEEGLCFVLVDFFCWFVGLFVLTLWETQ